MNTDVPAATQPARGMAWISKETKLIRLEEAYAVGHFAVRIQLNRIQLWGPRSRSSHQQR